MYLSLLDFENGETIITTIPQKFEDNVEEYIFGEKHLNYNESAVQYMVTKDLRLKLNEEPTGV